MVVKHGLKATETEDDDDIRGPGDRAERRGTAAKVVPDRRLRLSFGWHLSQIIRR